MRDYIVSKYQQFCWDKIVAVEWAKKSITIIELICGDFCIIIIGL